MIITSPSAQKYVHKYLPRIEKNEVWAIGGGQVAEEGKIVASHLRKKLVVVPTNLSCDSFWAPSVALRDEDSKYPVYVTKTNGNPISIPRVIFDDEILSECPDRFLRCGWAEILCSLSAQITWTPTTQQEMYARKKMAQLVNSCQYTTRLSFGRKMLFHALRSEVQTCELVGHSKAEEGLEHKIAYRLEKFNSGLCHSELVLIGTNEILFEFKSCNRATFDNCLRTLGVPLMGLYVKVGGSPIVRKIREQVLKEWRRER